MDTPRKKVRFEIKNQLGEGSFSKSFRAYDNKLKKEVALKVEKENKNKKILKFEYEILKALQSDTYVPKVYEFIENKNSNFIVMELLGKNVATFKKCQGEFFTDLKAYDILLQMLDSIEILHDKGYIHRDIKPTNFVIGIDEEKVYMVDFGLAKIHLDENGVPVPQREKTEFRGTLTYASLNAHEKKELSRRDDLFSFFFVILDLLNECLLWRTCNDDKDEIKKKKEECLKDPENLLLISTCKGKTELLSILKYIKTLKYEDRPDYDFIRKLLNDLKRKELKKQSNQVKYNWMNSINHNNFMFYHNNNFDNDNSRVNLFQNFTIDSSLYVVNPYQNNNNQSTNFSTNGSLPYFLTLHQNSTNNSSTLNNINFKDNFTGLNNLYNILNSTNNQDFSIKQPILKKKRRRISLKEECIEDENKDDRNSTKPFKKLSEPTIINNNQNDDNDSKIFLNNNMVPAENYFLFIENLKHLKKEEPINHIPVYFPHNIGGIPGFSPFNINPQSTRPINVAYTPPNIEKCILFYKDRNPYYI